MGSSHRQALESIVRIGSARGLLESAKPDVLFCAKRYLRWDAFQKHCLSVCLSVCLQVFFGVLLPGYGACFIHLLTDVLTQKSCFCSFGPKMSQFAIELPIRSSGLGVPSQDIRAQALESVIHYHLCNHRKGLTRIFINQFE